jgi:hypothetical protein
LGKVEIWTAESRNEPEVGGQKGGLLRKAQEAAVVGDWGFSDGYCCVLARNLQLLAALAVQPEAKWPLVL